MYLGDGYVGVYTVLLFKLFCSFEFFKKKKKIGRNKSHLELPDSLADNDRQRAGWGWSLANTQWGSEASTSRGLQALYLLHGTRANRLFQFFCSKNVDVNFFSDTTVALRKNTDTWKSQVTCCHSLYLFFPKVFLLVL